MRLRSLRLLALLPLLLAGCDVADPTDELFTFEVRDITYTFTLPALGPDAPVSVAAQAPFNILERIREQGFGPEEVERVRLVSGEAQIRVLNPASADIGFIKDVSLRLTGGGESAEVASAEDVSGGVSMLGEAALDVSSENIADIVTEGDFAATLDLSTDDDISGGLYRVEVRFDLEVSVEGF